MTTADRSAAQPVPTGSVDDVDDAQIRDIVEQEIAVAVADPEPVFVARLEYDGDEYTSVHTSALGAETRVRETARQWGFDDVDDEELLTYRIIKLPLETP